MKDVLKKRCDLFIENRNRIKHVFSWDSGLIHLSCAGIFTTKDRRVDEEILEKCKQMIKENVGPFSNFRSTVRPAIASMMATSNNPEEALEKGLTVYSMLKKRFHSSIHLVIASMTIAQMTDESNYDMIAERTKNIYKQIKAEHPFLTGSGDSAYCALMALSNKADGELIEEAERAYPILKGEFFSADAVQSLSHVLALGPDNINDKVERVIDLFAQLKSKGYKYGTSYELPTLGVLILNQENLDEIIDDIIEIDTWLSKQKGFGFFSSVSKKQRLMYASMLAQNGPSDEMTLQASTVNSTISLIIAQQVAMTAAIVAGSSAGNN